jgi:phosphatidylserine decarboxylase
MSDQEALIDARYRRLFGYRAGYLPRDRRSLDGWNRGMRGKLDSEARPLGDAVARLGALIETNPIVRMYVSEMIRQVPHKYKVVHNTPELLQALEHITVTAPLYNQDPARRNAFPMSSLFAYMMMTRAGEAVFRDAEFNRGLRGVLRQWCAYLDSPDSAHVLNEGPSGWLSTFAYQDMRLWEFEYDRSKPHWGFESYNGYFHREIKPEARPVAAPDDRKSSSRRTTGASSPSPATSSRRASSGSRVSRSPSRTCWTGANIGSGSSAATCSSRS